MEITLVPSTVSAGKNPVYQYLTTYRINGAVALDAGSLGLYQGPEEQAPIRHVLLSHTHLDHLATLPIFLENVYEAGSECVTIHGSAAVLECLQQDLFNGRVWPDFVGLSLSRPPFLKQNVLRPGEQIELGGLRITPIPVHHAVPTFGFLVEDAHAAVAFSSDTGPTDEIWERAGRLPHLKAVFLEATFPNDHAWLAQLAGHHTPATFREDIRKLPGHAAIIAVHIKPRYRVQVIEELRGLELPNLEIGQVGKKYVF